MSRVLLVLLLLLSGCETSPKRDSTPGVIEVPVEKRAEIPAFAKSEVLVPEQVGDSVYSVIRHRDQLRNLVEYLRCHRRLLREMELGPVDPESCKQ